MGIAAGKAPVVPAPVVVWSQFPVSRLTCGQGVLLDEVQAAPDEAVEGIERAGHPVQRWHPNLGMRVGEAEDAAGAGEMALLGAGGMQQRPSQQQPSRPHGFGGEEGAGGGSVSLRAGGGACPALDGSLWLGSLLRETCLTGRPPRKAQTLSWLVPPTGSPGQLGLAGPCGGVSQTIPGLFHNPWHP